MSDKTTQRKKLRARTSRIFVVFSFLIVIFLLVVFVGEKRWEGSTALAPLLPQRPQIGVSLDRFENGFNVHGNRTKQQSKNQIRLREQYSRNGYDMSESSQAPKGLILEKTVLKKSEIRMRTDAGVDVSDPQLYETVFLNGDSSTATVMGMAAGYGIDTFKLFVGSLRNSGFKGNIILGLDPDAASRVVEYLQSKGVTIKTLKWVECTHHKHLLCADPYPDLKLQQTRFPLQRDWLLQCTNCTGPVLVIDVRDTFFQLDPFGPGSPSITGLQVFQEHPNQTTEHWLTDYAIKRCKGLQLKKPMLCSGSTIGTRAAMLKYLEVMYEEMKVWSTDPNCRWAVKGDDQAIHNYLYYTGQLPFAHSIPNRMGIVNTAGYEGAQILRVWKTSKSFLPYIPLPGANKRAWIGRHYNLTDAHGFFTQYDGSRSRVIHQADRFGHHFWDLWLPQQSWITGKRARLKETAPRRDITKT